MQIPSYNKSFCSSDYLLGIKSQVWPTAHRRPSGSRCMLGSSRGLHLALRGPPCFRSGVSRGGYLLPNGGGIGPSQYHGAMVCLVLRGNPVCPPRISACLMAALTSCRQKGRHLVPRPTVLPRRSSDPMSQRSLKSAKPQAHEHSRWLLWLHVDTPWPPLPPWGGGFE